MTDWQQRTAVQRTRDLLNRLRGSHIQYDLTPFAETVTAINNLAPDLANQPDDTLQSRAAQIRAEIQNGRPPQSLLIEIFALDRLRHPRPSGLHP
jgi:preprotein translocase subunit SecA